MDHLLLTVEQAEYVDRMVRKVTMENPAAPEPNLRHALLEQIATDPARTDSYEISAVVRSRWQL